MNHQATRANPANTVCKRFSVAPMMNWTHQHCRMFHRHLSRHTWLYTEMVTTGALLHGDRARYLDFNEAEHPIALQLGGCDPMDLAQSARWGAHWGYDEINLNCGCPSKRVQKGSFGACLMATPRLVAECIKAMSDAVTIDITVKHRIGINDQTSYAFVRDFVGTIAEAGCQTFIVHARAALLQGLNPKENRHIPPLRYEVVYQLKQDFPSLKIILNGGIKTIEAVDTHLPHVDGIMLGRQAYHTPYLLASIDQRYYASTLPPPTRAEVIRAMLPYIRTQWNKYRQQPNGKHRDHLSTVTRPMCGLMTACVGAKHWRRMLSDARQEGDAIIAYLEKMIESDVL